MCSVVLFGVTVEQRRIAELEAVVAARAGTIEAQQRVIERLEARVAELERRSDQHSGNTGSFPGGGARGGGG